MNKVESALQRTTDTKALVIGVGTLPRTAEMFNELFPGCRAVVVADTNTWRVAGGEVHRILADAGIGQDEPHVFADPKLYAEWSFVEELDGVLAATDAVPVAVGSGVINDLTKLCSHHNGRRYMVVGTAASMDGYTAYGASITKDGNKQTFDCPAPLGMVLDPTIAAAAPAKMSASGYADLIAKIPAGADWMLADAVGSELLDEFAFSVVQDGLKDALCDPAGVRAGNVAKVEQLAEGLLLSGFAMQATQSSRPASGAEHQFSHLWDMEHLKYNGASVSHGFKVGIGTRLRRLLSRCCSIRRSRRSTSKNASPHGNRGRRPKRISTGFSTTILSSWPAVWSRPKASMSIRRGCAASCSVCRRRGPR